MTERERFQRVADVFEGARSRRDDDRESFLREACGADAALLADVSRLLARHDDQASPLDEPLAPPGSLLEAADRQPPPVIGEYRIKRRLGAGGMGVVYLAEQERPRREVALKVIRPGVLTRELLKRFDTEAAVLGRLQHPGIAQIFDAGSYPDADGTHPYFAMEYVAGAPILEHAASRRLGTRPRLDLFARVCDAAHHAHERGVIHRDLKPGNILVDAAGQPKILDFGVARATDSDLQVTTLRTDAGQLVGTIPYMSPEQVTGHIRDIGVRSDVYALGVILYELLVDRLPYDLSDVTLLHAARVIAEQEPIPLASVSRTYRGDLNSIVLKALEKAPQRRYQSAADLADDVRRFLSHRPIVARPATTAYQLARFARRHRGLVAGVVAAAAVLLAGTVVSTVLAIGQSRARVEAARRAGELEQVVAFQAVQLSSLDPRAMGEGIRDDLLGRLRAALAAEGLPESEAASSARAWEEALSSINFTDVALRSLEAHYFSHALDAVGAQFQGQPLVQAHLYHSLSGTMRDLGLFEHAQAPLEQALAIRRRLLGDDDPRTLASIDLTGLVLKELGRLPEAEPYYRQSLAGRRRVLGSDHPDTLVSMINTGLLLKSRGDLPGAEAIFREAHAGAERALGAEHWITLQATNNVGVTLEDAERYDEALGYYERALAGRRRVLGAEHPDTLNSMNNMGTLLVRRGQLDDAAPYLENALTVRRRVLGDTHPDTLTSASNLGSLLRRQGRLDEAEGLYREVLEARRRTLGERHPNTLTSIHNMGSLLLAQERPQEAAEHFRRALEGRTRTIGPEHARTLDSASNLGAALVALGRFPEAERLLREAFDTAQAAHGPGASPTLDLARRLADLYAAWHDSDPRARHDASAALWRARLDQAATLPR